MVSYLLMDLYKKGTDLKIPLSFQKLFFDMNYKILDFLI